VNGGVWHLDVCDVGKRCVAGQCVLGEGDDFVQRCTRGATVCAGDRTRQICSADGTAWVPEACNLNEKCEAGECVPDIEASCDQGNLCRDSKTAIRCLGQDKGFELVECEGDTYCEFGRCRGAVCSVGSTCNGLNQIRECVDGTNLRDVQCGVNEVCRQDKDWASCDPRECNPGTTQCGDPRDPEVDPTKYFTTCVTGANSNVPEWATGECTGLTTCDPTQVAGANPCRQECTPGAQRCGTDAGGINDGWQTCQEDGTWGPVVRCNTGNASRLQCAIKPNLDASDLPEAVCAEPVCWWAFNNGLRGDGTCEEARIRECANDGTLGNPRSCETGICRNLGSGILSDGRVAGRCDTSALCEEGEERCVTTGVGGATAAQTWNAAADRTASTASPIKV
jgi:hypothetical protein